MLLLLWLYNLSLNWPESCLQPEKVCEDSELAREVWTQYCTCLSPKVEPPPNLQMYPSGSSTEMISQSQKRGRMQRMQASVMRICWVSLPDCSCGRKIISLLLISKAQNEAFSAFLSIHHTNLHNDQVFALALPLVPLDMLSLSVQQKPKALLKFTHHP